MFGLLQYPYSRPEVFIEGETQQTRTLASGSTGARAVLNALDRLADSFGTEIDSAARDLSVAEKQLEDYSSRTGTAFVHEAYLQRLSATRDKLKRALAGLEEDQTIIELAAEVKQLQSSQNIVVEPASNPKTTAAIGETPIAARVSRQRHQTLKRIKSEVSQPPPHVTEHTPKPAPKPVRVRSAVRKQHKLF